MVFQGPDSEPCFVSSRFDFISFHFARWSFAMRNLAFALGSFFSYFAPSFGSTVISPPELAGSFLRTTTFSYFDYLTPASNVTAEVAFGSAEDMWGCFNPQFNGSRFQGRAAFLFTDSVVAHRPRQEYAIAECFRNAGAVAVIRPLIYISTPGYTYNWRYFTDHSSRLNISIPVFESALKDTHAIFEALKEDKQVVIQLSAENVNLLRSESTFHAFLSSYFPQPFFGTQLVFLSTGFCLF